MARAKQLIHIKTINKRVPIELITTVEALIKDFKDNIKKQKMALKPKKKTKKELIQELEFLKMQMNLPIGKEREEIL